MGPAGGLVFYNNPHYKEDGWRYLEAAPLSNEWRSKVWGGYRTNVGETGTAIGTGESNTEIIVLAFGDNEPYEGKSDYAAKLCADLVVSKDGVEYDDWFLPSRDELNLMYENLKRNNLGGFSDLYYWSSSEYNFFSMHGPSTSTMGISTTTTGSTIVGLGLLGLSDELFNNLTIKGVQGAKPPAESRWHYIMIYQFFKMCTGWCFFCFNIRQTFPASINSH